MQPTLLSFVIVAAGGATGAVARFGLTMATLRYAAAWPVGTLASNLIGCFVMGIIVQMLVRIPWLAEGGVITDHLRLLFAIGFCGAFTTLSALVLEMSTMLERQQPGLAFAYLLISVGGGYALFLAGGGLLRLFVPGSGG